jgi:hypothetical protein
MEVLVSANGFEGMRAAFGADGPDAHQPEVSEAKAAPGIELRVRDVRQGDGACLLSGEVVEPAAGVDFVQER